MKLSSYTLLGFLLISFISAVQDFKVSFNQPITKDEFVISERNKVLAEAIDADKEESWKMG